MSNLQTSYERISRLQEFVVLAYAVAVFLPITYSWIVLISGIVVTVLLGVIGFLSKKSGEATSGAPVCSCIRMAPLAVPLIIYALAAFVTGIFNGGINEGLASVVTLRAFLIYFVAFHAFQNSARLLSKAVVVLLSFGAIAGVWGAIQQIFHYHPFEKFQYLQASGFMGNPMAYAGQMEITGCLAFALLLTGGYQTAFKNKILFSLIAACNLAGVLFASERSAWLGMLAGVVSMSALLPVKVFLQVIGSGLVAALGAWFAVPVVQQRLVPMIMHPETDVGVQARFKVWDAAMDVFKQHPVLGVGVRNFPKLDIPEAIVPGESTYLVHAHNNYLHVLSTMGVVGLLAFAYLQVAMLLIAFKQWRGNSDAMQRAVGLGILGGIVSLMVAGLFEYNFGTGHVRLMHWFVLAMLATSNLGIDPGQALEAPADK